MVASWSTDYHLPCIARSRADGRRACARGAATSTSHTVWGAASTPAGSRPTAHHLYPAHAAFGGYKQSGVGRENYAMMLGHYQQTKNLLVSYSPKALGFF